MSSDNFFNQSIPGQQEKVGQLKSRRPRAAAPPPPPRPSASASASAGGYYGKNSSTTSNTRSAAAASPPPRPRASAGAKQQSKVTTAASTTSANHATSKSTAAPSFYGNTGGYSNTTASNATSSSYYGTPAPAAATTQAQNDGWYSAPAPAAANTPSNDWYSATPQQSQFQTQQQQPPAYSDFSQPKQSSTELAGTMDGGSTSTSSSSQQPFYTGSTFTPTVPPSPATMQSSSTLNDDDFENEPPLLEELGINMQHILIKTKAVVLPFKRFNVDAQAVMHDTDNDLAGPLVFALLLGGELLLSGKFQFSYIYGFGLFGCVSMTIVLNLMTPTAVSIWTVASILGYALLPVNLLAIVKIVVVNLGKLEKVGGLLAVLTIAWCTVASTRLLEQKCGMRNQRYLVAYPIALLYSAFVMITIF